MGFHGHLLAFRTDDPDDTGSPGTPVLPELPYPDETVACPDGWWLLTTRIAALPEDLAVRLAERTGAPALVVRVLHGDWSEVRGCVPGGAGWSFAHNVRLVVEHEVRERFGCEREDEGLSAAEWQECVDEVTAAWTADRAEARRHALAWSAATGRPADPAVLELALESDELSAEEAARTLLRALGVPVPGHGRDGRGVSG
ncbi:hypothetical protein ACIQBJ_34205 [Kitasatospora sp. NPDC088391]|uniref:hypothetical protein n=1 Tax=Kitasatospora sp. NPDC088391 TaxID=3364074 RepID=UPI0037F1A0DE